MKKSELLNKITDILKENTFERYYDVQYPDIAHEILELCLKCGMKPPVKTKDPVLLTDIYQWGMEE